MGASAELDNSRGVTPQIPFEIRIADELAGAASDIRS
jgi:hypothetical protein